MSIFADHGVKRLLAIVEGLDKRIMALEALAHPCCQHPVASTEEIVDPEDLDHRTREYKAFKAWTNANSLQK